MRCDHKRYALFFIETKQQFLHFFADAKIQRTRWFVCEHGTEYDLFGRGGAAKLAQQIGIVVGYHNHIDYVGASTWDTAKMLEGLDPKWSGYYFDPCHAVSEGGGAGWKVAFSLAAQRLKMVAIKDFYWEKNAKGIWRERVCPLGEGMVDWKYFFGALAKSAFSGPISLHIEYDPADVSAAATKDLSFLRNQLQS